MLRLPFGFEGGTTIALQDLDQVFVGADRFLREELLVMIGVDVAGLPGVARGDVRVPGAAELSGEPAQFRVEAGDNLVAEDFAEDFHDRADAPHRDAHLVNAFRIHAFERPGVLARGSGREA